MKRSIVISFSLALLLVINACSGTEKGSNNFDPNKPVNSNQPMPVEPDGGIGDITIEEVVRDKAFVEDVQLLIMESYPVQIALDVSGKLPTECHELQYDISQPDAENQIFVEIYSMVDPGHACAELMANFSESISLPVSDLLDGVYKVFVNGELVGEFSYPA